MSRLTNAFVGRDTQYFDLFEAAATNVVRAAELLEEMLNGWPDSQSLARDILVCEQDGDRITHDIIRRLNQTFVTPIDREAILELASAFDFTNGFHDTANVVATAISRGRCRHAWPSAWRRSSTSSAPFCRSRSPRRSPAASSSRAR